MTVHKHPHVSSSTQGIDDLGQSQVVSSHILVFQVYTHMHSKWISEDEAAQTICSVTCPAYLIPCMCAKALVLM